MGPVQYLRTVFGRREMQRKVKLWLMDGQPILRGFGQNVYLSDFVNNAIDRVASEISKIDVRSVTVLPGSIETNDDSITRLFSAKPNEYQTASDFLSSVEWLRRKNCNAFIYPKPAPYSQRDIGGDGEPARRYAAFYPLNPLAVYIGTRDGVAVEARFQFEDGYDVTLPYDSLIHLKWRRGTNMIAGGNDSGYAETGSLLRTVDALDRTIEGLPKSIEASMQIKGVYSAKTLVEAEKLKKVRDEFEDHIVTSKSGMLAVDLGGEFTPVNIPFADIPKDTLAFLKSIIEERYGVSAAILSGDYDGEQHSAFYQTAIEDFVVQFEQAATAALFTSAQRAGGKRIKAYYSKVNYMDQSAKMELANLAKETGNMTLNEINEMFGLQPFPEGNRRLQSLNYSSLDLVDAYQLARAREGRPLTEERV